MALIEELNDETPDATVTKQTTSAQWPIISSESISKIELLNPLPLLVHVYVLPFLLLYPAAIYAYTAKYTDWLGEEQANTFLLCLCLFGSHALSFLSTKWSDGFKTKTTCFKVCHVAGTFAVALVFMLFSGELIGGRYAHSSHP